MDDHDAKATEILEDLIGFFGGRSRPRTASPPCTVCGRPCKYAVQAHPRCIAALSGGRDEARRLRDEWWAKKKA